MLLSWEDGVARRRELLPIKDNDIFREAKKTWKLIVLG